MQGVNHIIFSSTSFSVRTPLLPNLFFMRWIWHIHILALYHDTRPSPIPAQRKAGRHGVFQWRWAAEVSQRNHCGALSADWGLQDRSGNGPYRLLHVKRSLLPCGYGERGEVDRGTQGCRLETGHRDLADEEV
ncbi:hypothetical protein DPMN_167956 [Dreissena polymorpha]|uniref:Uncharacterized protein n=1 Tax=Dreissena polymorpha TaxID=45954 RepID=A0A9D4IZ74_DREPO|nr:hypothetical protein DPMN_167956 [Dreissena polymorpha]